MVAAPFSYLRVDSYDAAVGALQQHGEDGRLIAGGQSLVPMLNLRLARPSVLIDINDVDRRPVEVDGSTLRLPALTRHRVLMESPVVRQHCPLLSAAVAHVGNVRVRSRGTIGGSLAHADPTAELGCTALALDAVVVARGPGGERSIPARDFFVTYLATALEPTEVLTDVVVPVARPGQGWSFKEMVRRSSDFAIVAVAAWLELDEAGEAIGSVRLALAGVADRVVLVDAEHLAGLVGSRAEERVLREAGAAVAGSVDPDTDVHASGAYRKRLVDVLTRRALGEAFERATLEGQAA
jgi:aerobic carbon-monoxide dehydrogenase medium subunit